MKKAFLMMCAGTVSILLAGCAQENVYDPNAVTKKYDHAWEKNFGKIDPNQTWNTATRVTAEITINEDALSEYTFHICTGNPLSNENSSLIAQTKVTTNAQGTAKTSITFDAPEALKSLFISRIDNHGRRAIKVFDRQNNILHASFGKNATQTRASVTDQALPTMDNPYTETEVQGFIESGYDLANGLSYNTEWGGTEAITSFFEVCLVEGNSSDSPISVITTKFEGSLNTSSTYTKWNSDKGDTDYYYVTKGEKVRPDWSSNFIGYKKAENKITTPGIVKLVIADGGSYTLSNSVNPNVANMDIIVANGGTLNIRKGNTVQMNADARIIIMPGGTLNDLNEVNDKTQYNPSINHDAGTAVIYNAGTMNIRWINLNSATLYNASEAIIQATGINFANDNCVLTNHGKIDVDAIVGNGEQGTINNGCLLRSKREINVKYLNMAANTSIECDKIYFWELTLRENSIVRTKHLSTNNTDIQYIGEGNPALISAENIDFVNVGNFKIAGKIYFEANNYTDGFEGNQYSGYWLAITRAISASDETPGLFKVGEAPVTITPGYSGEDLASADCVGKGNTPTDTPEPTPTPEPQSWLLACEDLGNTDDFDFNDIVFCVSHVAGTTEATVTPLAAGGTLEAHIYYGNQDLGEIHQLLGQSGYTITNTNGSKGTAGEAIKITVPADFSMTTDMGGFKVIIKRNEKEMITINAPQNGTAPQMICIDNSGEWAWPIERTNISEAYPDFGEWGANYNNTPEWYKKPVSDKVVK